MLRKPNEGYVYGTKGCACLKRFYAPQEIELYFNDGRDKKFGIGAKITYEGGYTKDKCIPANFAVTEWQFVSGAFTLSDETSATRKPVSITVYGIFQNQSNKVNFDDFMLAKEDVPSYTYNSKGNLVSAVDNAKGNQQMSYAANGVDMTQYRNAVSDVYTYDSNGNLSGIKKFLADGTQEKYGAVCNIFGDVVALYNSSGSLIAQYHYDTWGKLLSITNASGTDISSTDGIWLQNSIRYRGYVYDNETGFYYVSSRYYDPEIGRFINADGYVSTGQGITGYNMFAYCGNNPVIYIDINGQMYNLIKMLDNAIPVLRQMNLIAHSEKLPIKGVPNSKQKTSDGKQEREYGPDGKAKRDLDYGHPHHHPELPSPHAHDWEWNGDIPIRGPAYAPMIWDNGMVGTTIICVCIMGTVWIVGNNVSGIGVADDALVPVFVSGIKTGIQLLQGG